MLYTTSVFRNIKMFTSFKIFICIYTLYKLGPNFLQLGVTALVSLGKCKDFRPCKVFDSGYMKILLFDFFFNPTLRGLMLTVLCSCGQCFILFGSALFLGTGLWDIHFTQVHFTENTADCKFKCKMLILGKV